MLINFSLNNYCSYGDKQTFSTLCNTDKSHLDQNTFNFKAENISLISVIYGANASGKTNLFKALNFIKEFFVNSNNLTPNGRIPVVPFKFIDSSPLKPSEFEITFIKDNVKYRYGFSCNHTAVISEYLDVYNSSKPSNIFTRTDINDYKFNTDQKLLESIKTKNNPNKLFVCTAATWNYEKVKPVVEYILNDMFLVFDYRLNGPLLDKFKKDNMYDEYKDFCIKILNQADINISDFEMNDKKIDRDSPYYNQIINTLKLITNKESFETDSLNMIEFNTYHNINGKMYPLKLEEESFGTQNLFNISPILFEVLKFGKTLVIDEIDRSIHPLLVRYIVNLFCEKDINKNNAQLICNSHDTNLLDLDILRRDEIWFTEKDYKTGLCKLFSLSDFSPRKSENVQKNYLIGRYGSIPFITKSGDIWQD